MAASIPIPSRPAAALLAALLALGAAAQTRQVARLQRSAVRFNSIAPLETITAENSKARGVIDLDERSFAVQLPVVEFVGFNAPLQREHFQENYMVVGQWPNATFTGRIIESIDLRSPGEHAVRAKGELVIRGQSAERVLPCTVEVTPTGIRVRSRFEVPVADHGIRIPRVVQQKVAAVVDVEADLFFAR